MRLVSLDDITAIAFLKGHTKAVRKATWHPSGALLVCLRNMNNLY